ncbi:MAG: putative nucleotidyltransferase [Parcubacteria group bacterium Gr01-1014_33]|nr:MAG: putative nucleotidyltransferase [Parcubacteria group bacterium Gr01-1014_33]
MEGIKLIILFGSQATGRAGKRSDTDIAILADHPLSFAERGQIAEKIAKELGTNEDDIDTVDLWDASPLLQYEVAKKGKLLKGEEYDFVRFKVLAWKRYLDTAKFRRARERVLDKEFLA